MQFNKLPKESGFDSAQPALVERSRWHSLSVKRKPDPTNIGDVISTKVPNHLTSELLHNVT